MNKNQTQYKKLNELDFSAFDRKESPFITLLYKLLTPLAFLTVILFILAFVNVIFFLALVPFLFLLGYLFILGPWKIPGVEFARTNKLPRPFLNQSTNYNFIYNEYKNMKQSAILKDEDFVWGIPIGESEFGAMFLRNKDVAVWARLKQDLPHIVIDGTKNNRLITNNIKRGQLPKEEVLLEGDFPEYFKVYAEKDREVLTLQILSPDRMAVLIDKLDEFDLEIKGNHLKIYAVNAQNSSQKMKNFFATLELIERDLKIDRLNKIKIEA